MIWAMLKKERRAIQLNNLIIFVLLAIIFLVITTLLQSNTNQIYKNEVKSNELSVVNVESTLIENKITIRESDVLYLADSLSLSCSIDDDGSLIEQHWISFSNRQRIYDQVRYIDQNGDEVIRINYGADGAFAVAQDELQNKADKSYFINTMLLEKNQVFVSRLDLSVENGETDEQGKPTIRLATPYYGTDDELEGIVILNYYAEDMLEQVRSIASTSMGEIYLLNLEGYWLYNSEKPETEWAFMFEDREDESFAAEFPQEWEAIINGGESGFLNTENGVFTYTCIALNADSAQKDEDEALFYDSGIFYIVSYIDADSDTGELFEESIMAVVGYVVVKYLSIYFLLSGVAFVLAFFVAMSRAQKKEIQYFSEYDVLTGLYNRRAGYMKLNEMKKNAARKGCRVAVCFIDINGLKEVNDRLGHETGDELIQSIAGVIKDAVRGDDFVARLGGDEFLIVLGGLEESGAETVWGRIAGGLKRINENEDRAYAVSASHGIAVFRCGDTVSIDEIINLADEKMYQEKREIKKTLRVIRREE